MCWRAWTEQKSSLGKVREFASTVLLGLMLILVSGCIPTPSEIYVPTFYEAPRLPASEVAMLEFVIDEPDLPLSATIDGRLVRRPGRPTNNAFRDRRLIRPVSVSVCPGRRNIAFAAGLKGDGNAIYGGVNVEVRPGRVYVIHSIRLKKIVWTWVVDKTSGEIVSGKPPPEK